MNLQVNEFCYILTWSADFCDDASADFVGVTVMFFSVSYLEGGICKGLWEVKYSL